MITKKVLLINIIGALILGVIIGSFVGPKFLKLGSLTSDAPAGRTNTDLPTPPAPSPSKGEVPMQKSASGDLPAGAPAGGYSLPVPPPPSPSGQ